MSRDATRSSLSLPIWAAEIASLLYYSFVLCSVFCVLSLFCATPPSFSGLTSHLGLSIHRPSTFPLQRHVPPDPLLPLFPATVLAIAATQATYVSSIIPPILHRSAARTLLFPVHRCYCGCYYCALFELTRCRE
jgi:hypothetical protein